MGWNHQLDMNGCLGGMNPNENLDLDDFPNEQREKKPGWHSMSHPGGLIPGSLY